MLSFVIRCIVLPMVPNLYHFAKIKFLINIPSLIDFEIYDLQISVYRIFFGNFLQLNQIIHATFGWLFVIFDKQQLTNVKRVSFVSDLQLVLFPDWKNSSDQTYSCPKISLHHRLQLSGPLKPLVPSQHGLVALGPYSLYCLLSCTRSIFPFQATIPKQTGQSINIWALVGNILIGNTLNALILHMAGEFGIKKVTELENQICSTRQYQRR